jgi:hypothetical protein
MSMNCENEEVCLKPLIEHPTTESESKCTQCTTEPPTCSETKCEETDCEGCEHCETSDESDLSSDETDSDNESENESENDLDIETDSENIKEDFTRKFKHVINYFLATTDVLENRIKNSNTIMFATVAPLYIGMAFLFGSLYGH